MNVLTLAKSLPTRTLEAGDILITQGSSGGDLFILESGRLAVERDGVKIATVDLPGALIGEMSVLLRTAASATVRAEEKTHLRVMRDARKALESDQALTFQVAAFVAGRLDATSAYLVELASQERTKAEHGLLAGILSRLHLPARTDSTVSRADLFDPSLGEPR